MNTYFCVDCNSEFDLNYEQGECPECGSAEVLPVSQSLAEIFGDEEE